MFKNDIPSMSANFDTIRKYSIDISIAMQNLQITKEWLGTYCITLIGWNPPKAGCHSHNTNDWVTDSHFSTVGGGLLRVCSGKWVAGFSKNLVSCSMEEAELWALIFGLQLAWCWNYGSLTIEMVVHY